MASFEAANEVLRQLARDYGSEGWLRTIEVAGEAGEYHVALRVGGNAPEALPELLDGVKITIERLSTNAGPYRREKVS